MSTSAHLRQDPILAELSGEALEALVPRLEWVQIGAGDLVVRQGALDRDLYFLLGGEARILYAGIEVGRLGSGEHFGELGLLAARPRAVTIQAVSDLHLARLGLEPFEQIARESPDVGLHLVRAMVDGLGERLHGMTEGVRHLLRERSLPRRAKLEIRVSGEPKRIWSGTPLGAILPARVGTDLTVAGLVDRRARSLVSLIGAECEIEPLTTGHWEGRRIYRASLGQLLLEAGSRIDGGLKLWMQQSLGYGQRVGVSGLEPAEGEAEEAALERLAEQLEEMMRGLVRADAPLCEEWWTPDEAISHFLEHDWGAAAELLSSWHSATVPMVTYGRIYALGLDPRVANTGAIGGFRVVAEAGGLLLVYGGEGSTGRSIPAPPPEGSPPLGTPDVSGARAVCRHTCAPIAEHERWLSALGATTVGELARACIGGNVAQLIRVAEGYHEKAIGRIADAIRDRRSEVDVVCIAGPSSSGKTTFIKRLSVQLQVEGIRPKAVSLDDYYVDRVDTPRDALGEYDYEAFEALRVDLLSEHVLRLLEGEAVQLPRFDFKTGSAAPEGGEPTRLRRDEVLMLEGIHGLNPELLRGLSDARIFRVFVSPMAQLPLDRLSRIHASDVRLLRRIVRDRHGRKTPAAETILRWPSVRRGERRHIFPHQQNADAVFDASLIYEPCVLRVFAERYLLEVPREHAAFTTAHRLLGLLERFVTIYPDHVPPTSLLREFIGGSGFER